MKNQGKPDSENDKLPSNMYLVHCREEFAELKTAMDRIADVATTRADKADAERKELATSITKLTTIVTNGLSHKVEAMDKRMWAVVGFSLVTLIGMLVEIILHR